VRAQPYWCCQGSRVAEDRAFSENSLGNYLDELIDEGLVQHVDPAALADRRVAHSGELAIELLRR